MRIFWRSFAATAIAVLIIIFTINSPHLTNTVESVAPANWSFGGAGDWSCNADAHQTATNIETRGVNVVLGLGDFSYQSTANCWFDVISAFDANMHITIGNHDDESSTLLNEYMTHFGLTNQFYSFDYQDVHFLSISTELPISSTSDQYNFVINDLQQTSQNSSIHWIVAFMHKPLYTSTSNHAAEATYRNALHPLFDQYNVDVVLQGHNHNYQRTYPLTYNPGSPSSPIITSAETTNYSNPSAPIFVLVGTAGAPKYPLKDQASFVARQFNDTSGFLNFNVTNNGQTLNGTFFSNTDGGQGYVRDSFSITKDAINGTPEPPKKTDFNGDAFGDLAIGVPNEEFGSAKTDAGGVNVIYGSASALSATSPKADQFWHQDSASIEGANEAGDKLGSSLASGDFNNDGYSDLAIGVPEEDVGTIFNAGGVNIIYGSSAGLRASAAGDGTGRTDQFWSQDSSSIEDSAEANDQFGSSLASGDFNDDEFWDLAVGVIGDEIGSVSSAGSVNIIYGSAGGLTELGSQLWNQDSSGIKGTAETGNQFAFCLVANDFNNDGRSDLVVGVPHEDFDDLNDEVKSSTGAVNVLYGSSSGLNDAINQLWQQDTAVVEDTAEAGDEFGRSLA